MIVQAPSWEEFRESGIVFMDLGWTYAMDRLLILNNIAAEDWCSAAELDEVRSLSRKPLSASLALVQQGVELLLKGRIAEESPFLLIKDQPRQWPRRSTERDVPFAEFRTIDSQDLVRVYETVKPEPLAESFKQTYESLRRHRNTAFHTVDANLEIESKQILMAVLEAADSLLGAGAWFPAHRELLGNSPEHAFDDLFLRMRMMHEMELVEDMLSASEMQRFVGYDVAGTSYRCPSCSYASSKGGGKDTYAQRVSSSGAEHPSLYCYCCSTVLETIFVECRTSDCNSTFLSEDRVCLICGTEYDEWDIEE